MQSEPLIPFVPQRQFVTSFTGNRFGRGEAPEKAPSSWTVRTGYHTSRPHSRPRHFPNSSQAIGRTARQPPRDSRSLSAVTVSVLPRRFLLGPSRLVT